MSWIGRISGIVSISDSEQEKSSEPHGSQYVKLR